MNITHLKRARVLPIIAGMALVLSSFWSMQSAYAIGEITTTAAAQGAVVLDGNGGPVLATFSPDLDLASSTSAALVASSTADVAAYYGVRVQSATTTGDVFWRIVVSHATESLATSDVMITEKGYFDGTGGTVSDSAYTATASTTGDLVFEGNAGWETMAGDDFTNVDEIVFDTGAPLGIYTVTRTLIDNSASTTGTFEIDAPFSFTVNLSAAADIVAPVFATTTDIMATATTSAGAIVTYSATATDDTDLNVDIVCNPASGSLFAVGTTTVTCTAEDDASNTATTTFDVIVTLNAGTSTPGAIVITHPVFASGLFCATSTPVNLQGTADLGTTITITGGLGTSTATTTGAGNWSANVNLASNVASTILLTMRDAGNNVIATSTIDFNFDTTAPTITLVGGSTMSISEGGTFSDPGFNVSDNLDTNVTATTTGTVNVSTDGTYTITYTATDCAGNTATTTRTVTVTENSTGGSGSGRRSIPPGLLVAVENASPNSAVALVLAGQVEGRQGEVLGLAIGQFLRNLRIGMRGDDVAELQLKLQSAGLFKGPVSGYYGNMTAAAVRALQRGLGLPATGFFGPMTRAVLNGS